MIPGTTIRFRDGRELVLPPLSLGHLEDHNEQVNTLLVQGAQLSREKVAALVVLVHAALLDNYPEMDLETVRNGLHLRSFGEVELALMQGSGFESSGEARGEAYGPNGSTTSTSSAP